ncbi:ganglioside GM2 activator-like [Ornithodoros turicata]|uniref:ganglioside GM2 activator-like n=1 Tax=Ornithodoros turicata TaxID=34597 RepID=UPI00313A1253
MNVSSYAAQPCWWSSLLALVTLTLSAVPQEPSKLSTRHSNYTLDINRIRNLTWERYLLLLSTPQVPERYLSETAHTVFSVFQKWGEAVRKYTVRNCGSHHDPVRYDQLLIRPDPLAFPGNVYVDSAIEVLRDIEAPIRVEITMKKKVVLWISVPCVNDFGSCDYDNICSVEDCPLFYAFLGLPCGCPIKKGNYTVVNKEFVVQPLSLPVWLTSGDYQVTVKGKQPSEQLFCVHFTLSVK